MGIEPLGLHFEDPLSSFSLVSLLRTKVGRLSGIAASSEEQELEIFHEICRSTDLASYEKLSEQADKIIHDSLDLPNTDSIDRALPQGTKMALAVNTMDQPQIKRRPALGRKRSRFSLRPNTSQSCSNTDALSSIENLQDPEEFFAAFERLENADRLLKKLKGKDSTDPTQNHLPPKTRTRRQGIMGKTVSYKHLYPQLPDTAEKHSSSQEGKHELGGDLSSHTEIPTPANVAFYTVVDDCTHQEAPDLPSAFLETETSDSELLNVTQGKDSVAMVENRVGRLLDTLLSDCENLDEGGTISLLQERLQLKPIDVHRVSLPNPISALVNNLSASQKLPLKPTDEFPTNGLSFLRKIKSPFNGKTPIKLQPGSGNSSSPQTSPNPNPLKSPLSSIARLQRLNGKVNMPKNLVFEPPKENGSSGTHYSSVVDTGLQDISPPVDISKHVIRNSSFSHTSTDVDGIPKHADTCSGKTLVKFPQEADNSSCLQTSPTPPRSPFSSLSSPQRHEPQFNISLGPNRLPEKNSSSVVHMGIQAISQPIDTNNHDTRRLSFRHDPPAAHINQKSLSFDGKLQSQEENKTVDGHHTSPKVLTDDLTQRSDGSTWKNSTRSCCDVYIRPDEHNESKADEVEAIPCMTMISQGPVLCPGSPTTRTTGSSGCQLPAAGTSLPVDGNSGNLGSFPELDNEELLVPSRISLKKQKKRKDFQRRQSLAGAGTMWEGGVRRSTRIKIRPLEHWRGERFVFGRIHDSLATVIGLKYASPVKGHSNESPALKVKSYVSKEYAELLERSALH